MIDRLPSSSRTVTPGGLLFLSLPAQIKTLVFEHRPPNVPNPRGREYVVTVTPLDSNVCVEKLAAALGLDTGTAPSIALLPLPSLLPLTGYRAGSVPPSVKARIQARMQRGDRVALVRDASVHRSVAEADVVWDILRSPKPSLRPAAGLNSHRDERRLKRAVEEKARRAPREKEAIEPRHGGKHPEPTGPWSSYAAPASPDPSAPPPTLPQIIALYRPFPNQLDLPALLLSLAKSPHPSLSVPTLLAYVAHLHATGALTVPVPDLLMTPTDSSSKSALHLLFWKHPLPTLLSLLSLLAASSSLPLLDAVSTGRGNYGKSAVFYALTQNRSDAVELLLGAGASVLIVNNKGQTPRSLAPGHATEAVQARIREREEEELGGGGEWRNYWGSHPDKDRPYGDLDPRFLNGDNDKDGAFRREVAAFEGENGRLPEVVMMTSGESRKRINMRIVEGGKKWAEKEASLAPPKTKKQERIRQQKEEARSNEELRRKLEALPRAALSSLPSSRVVVVERDTLPRSLEELRACVAAEPLFGMDCEWKPRKSEEGESPVATLQLSCRRCNFVVDLQSLLRPFLDPSAPPTQIERDVCAALSALFAARTLLGFGMQQDLLKCAASFPHLPAFREYGELVDLSRGGGGSLQKLAGRTLDLYMRKEQQCSDWSERPLSAEQLEYAAIDAGILLPLYDALPAPAWKPMSMTLFLLGHNGAGYVLPPHGHVAACCRSFFAKFYLESDSKLLPTLAPPIWSPEKSAEDERKGREREERKKKGRELQAARDREAAEKGEKRVQMGDVRVDVGGLKAGSWCGQSKLQALRSLAGPSVKDEELLEFQTRSGVVPFANGAALFMNCGELSNVKFRRVNVLTADTATFRFGGKEPRDGVIVMFLRGPEEFLYLGELRAQSRDNKDVTYGLVEAELLSQGGEYADLVRAQEVVATRDEVTT